MSKASAEAFFKINNTGKRTTDLHRIYNFIKRNPLSHKNQIMRYLNLTHQTATARLSDLMDIGVIEIIEEEEPENTISLFIVQNNIEKANTNAFKRKEEKFKKWKKRGETQFSEFLNKSA